jgi:AcrR family transcriptional regulator
VPEPTRTRREQIVGVALDLLEEQGPEGVSMRAIAERIGIKAPSLYKHFRDKEALEVALVAAGFGNMATAFDEALEAGPDDELAALAAAYRRWALEHRHLYRLLTHRPIPRDQLPEGVEAAAAAPVVQVAGGDADVARALWAFAHGMASLELAGRFPPGADLDAAWHAGVEAMRARIDAVGSAPDGAVPQ